MPLILKQNYLLEELLFNQAYKLHMNGKEEEAERTLSHSRNSERFQCKSKRRISRKEFSINPITWYLENWDTGDDLGFTINRHLVPRPDSVRFRKDD